MSDARPCLGGCGRARRWPWISCGSPSCIDLANAVLRKIRAAARRPSGGG